MSGQLFSLLLCLFFCLECLSLQVFVAERTHSQEIQCKFHLPPEKYTTLFWKFLQCFFFFVVVYQVFFCFTSFFTFFPFIWRAREEVGIRRWELDFVDFLKLIFKGFGFLK